MREKELEPPPRPAWVIWLGIVLAVAVVAAIALMILIPGQHGPGRHM